MTTCLILCHFFFVSYNWPVGFKWWPIGRLVALMAVFLPAGAGTSRRRRLIPPGRAEQTWMLDATFASSLFAPRKSQELHKHWSLFYMIFCITMIANYILTQIWKMQIFLLQVDSSQYAKLSVTFICVKLRPIFPYSFSQSFIHTFSIISGSGPEKPLPIDYWCWMVSNTEPLRLASMLEEMYDTCQTLCFI